MSDFDDFMDVSSSEAAAAMADPILIGNKSVNSVFDENAMAVGMEGYGDTERITASAVVSKADLDQIPRQKTRIQRVRTGVTYYVESVNEDSAHVELMLYREGAKRGNG